MSAYHDCKIFQCVGCSKWKDIVQIHEAKALYTAYMRESEHEFRFRIAHIVLCDKCFKDTKRKKKKPKKK